MRIVVPGRHAAAFLLTATAFLFCPPATYLGAQEAADGGGQPQPATSPSLPVMTAHKVDESIRVDGNLSEPVWGLLPPTSGFVQKEPVEGAPAKNDSEVWLLYDESALYIGARLYDSSPQSIARNMVRRDSEYNGQFDYFEVMIDPNLDLRTGYRFRISAAGVQTDRYLYDDGQEDQNWDGVWSSSLQITEDGWTVEMRIPLSQIRYERRMGIQSWGINFGRRRAADNELTRFALESKLRPGRVSQFGRIDGITLERSASRIEVRPYALSRLHNPRPAPGNPFISGSETTARVGADIRYGLGSAFTLDAAINPDFGQVELDPAVINLTAFETFLDERRPFFVEDARVFDFRLSGGQNSLFYTRRIGREPQGTAPDGTDFFQRPDQATILGAAKLTGRTRGGLSVGALAAVTQSETGAAYITETGETIEFSAEPAVGYGVLRLNQDFAAGMSRVGGILTALQRSLPDDSSLDFLTSTAWNGGVDFEHSWNERAWALWGFLSGSHVQGDSVALDRIQRSSTHYLQRPDLDWSRYDPSRQSLTGAEWRLQFERRTGNWTGALWAAQVTSGFEINDLGFSRSRERLDGGVSVAFQRVTPNQWFRSYGISAFTFHNWSHEALRDIWSIDQWDRARTAGLFSVRSDFTFHNFWTMELSGHYGPENMSRTATRGGPVMRQPGMWGGEIGFKTDNRRMFTFRPSLQIDRGRKGAGSLVEVRAQMTVQPSSRIELEFSPRFDAVRNAAQYVATTSAEPFAPTYGDRYLFADLERRSVSMVTRLNWTFSPRLTLQLYAQPLISAADYVTYKQLAQPGTFDFLGFSEGRAAAGECVDGATCEDGDHIRYFDLDGDGSVDYSRPDLDFNLRTLRANAVLRWEYRPGSTIFFVWQRRQSNLAETGDFDFGRDLGALGDASAENTFIIKANIWLSR